MANILPLDLIEIKKVFSNNHWDFVNDFDIENIYNHYCDRFGILDNDIQKDLILDLTKRYVLIRDADYLSELRKLIDTIFSNELFINNKVYSFSIDGYNDKYLSKSGRFVTYLLNSRELQSYCKNKYKKEINLINIKEDLRKIDDNSILLLFDDIIGTGDTLNKCLKYIDSIGIDNSIIRICSIAILRKTKNSLQNLGFKVYNNIVLKKEISEYYKGSDLVKSIDAMKSIEKKLRVGKKFRFGYHGSELLITLSRTPNNTFPYFWMYNDEVGEAPFQR